MKQFSDTVTHESTKRKEKKKKTEYQVEITENSTKLKLNCYLIVC